MFTNGRKNTIDGTEPLPFLSFDEVMVPFHYHRYTDSGGKYEFLPMCFLSMI